MSNWKEEQNGETIIRSCCWSPPGCHPVGCGVRLHVKDGKLVKVEGDPEHPISKGALCARGLALKEYMYHPKRITYPMKRAKEDRGKDKWERCSWEEALDLVTENAKRISAQYGPESILVFGGTGREGNNYYTTIAMGVFGTPNGVYAQSGMSCYFPRLAMSIFLLGQTFPEIDYAQKFSDRYQHPGWEAPKYVLLWGKEPLKSNPDGLWGHAIVEMMQQFGTKVIMVDPRMTWLGTRSDMVLQLRPGSDAALALAMLHVIINEDLYDHDFVDKWTFGFEGLKERVQEYTPERAEQITWVPKEQIIEAARKFAIAKPSTIGWGLAIDQSPNGAQVAQALVALMALTGNIDIPGGISIGAPAFNTMYNSPDRLAIDNGMMSEETYQKRIGNEEYPALNMIMPTAAPDAVLDTLRTGKPYDLHMAMFQSSNVIGPAISAAPGNWYEGLKKLDFMFATDTFMNPTTMALADVFLPIATYAEHDSFIQSHYALNVWFDGAINKAVQVGECKCEIEVMLELGKRMHPDFWGQFKTTHDWIEFKMMPAELNMKYQELKEKVLVMRDKEPYKKYEKGILRPDGQPGFLTPSGRVELYAHVYEQFGDDPLPYYKEPPFSPISTPELFEKYPLILTTGARTYASFHSEHRQVPSLREIVPDPIVEIHPETAASLGIKEGDWCWIENGFGKCQQKAHLTPAIDKRVVHAMHGWWFPEKDGEAPNLYGNWESNINQLMPNKYNGVLGYGDTFKNQLCKVYKVSE